MMAIAKRISAWGIASLVLLVGQFVFGEYNLYVYDHHRTPLLSNATDLQLCAVVLLASAVCGVIAIRRGGSTWWMMIVLLATLMALSCYFGEI